MNFYQFHHWHPTESSQGFDWFTNKKEAQKALNKFKKQLKEEGFEDEWIDLEIRKVSIKPKMKSILTALECYASHPDNG